MNLTSTIGTKHGTNAQNAASRREFLKNTGRIATATALAGVAIPNVHAAENNTIQVALIGCGGRGTGAAGEAVSVKYGPVKLVALADVFPERLKASYDNLKKKFGDKIDVPQDRQFVGFDAYQKAMDCLKPGDIAIFATPLAFRWVDFAYAIQKGLNVFMEKPLTADGPTSRKMFQLADEATAKNLKVGVGLMSRHTRWLEQLAERIHDGEIGDLVLMRGYRMQGGSLRTLPKPAGISELLWQIQRFHSFLWASGGVFSDYYIHIIDHCCWMKDAWPVKAQALGGRHYRQSPDGVTYVDQNFDTYSVEYTFADETKFIMDGRCMAGCHGNLQQLCPWHQRHGDHLQTRRLRRALPPRSKASARRKQNVLWAVHKLPRTSEIPTKTNGTTWWTPSATTSLTTRCGAASKPAS